MDDSRLFSHVMEEYGTRDKEEEEPEAKVDGAAKETEAKKDKTDKKDGLMQAEERLTGSVTGSVYKRYFRFAGGLIKIPIILLLLTGYQGAQGTYTIATDTLISLNVLLLVANNLFLGFWTSQSIHGFGSGDYMGTYAALGVAIGVFSFLLSYFIRYELHAPPLDARLAQQN